ncbi:adenosine deaminase [Jannaschia sp. Os4]|uniref:adenosine deaminase n=1 Tax=Jannaschia sp. Os4 TaxID=2807617 RepID=UPI0019394A81|nr:adenosine deaminase [Jannaschia sp. Os4]MBM2576953.1 adenosine deaminase [Jannaschia sp. Os4]
MSAKVELHLHLEGAAPPDLIRQLAGEKKIDLTGVFAEDGGFATGDFQRFLKVYEAASSVLTTPEDYARLTRAVLERQRDHGVIYGEVFASPQLAAKNDMAAWRDHVDAVREAADGVDGIEWRMIPTCVRHFGPDDAKGAARCAAETAGSFVTGWGMGGDEGAGKPGDFAWSFDCAREAGLGITVHSGEFGGPQSVRDALDDLRPARIGHGVRAIEDLALVDRLAEDGVVLEVCPGSNVYLGVFDRLRAHPIEDLRRRGVRVTVSTDDPPFFRTNMTAEYEALHEAFDWDDGVFHEINRTAARAAFCDEATRAGLLKKLEAAWTT